MGKTRKSNIISLLAFFLYKDFVGKLYNNSNHMNACHIKIKLYCIILFVNRSEEDFESEGTIIVLHDLRDWLFRVLYLYARIREI